MAYRTLRGGNNGLGSPYSDLSGGGGGHGHHHGGGGFRGGFRGGWSGPAWEYPDYTFVNAGPRVMDCYRDAQGNLILGVPNPKNTAAKRGKCLVDQGGNILSMLPTTAPVSGLGAAPQPMSGHPGHSYPPPIPIMLKLRRPDYRMSGPKFGQIRPTVTTPLTAPGSSLVPRPRFLPAGVSGLGAAVPAQAAPAPSAGGPPPEAKEITQGLFLDMTRGDIWVGPTKVPILPAVLSAIVVKVIMFGGSAAGGFVAGKFSRKSAT